MNVSIHFVFDFPHKIKLNSTQFILIKFFKTQLFKK